MDSKLQGIKQKAAALFYAGKSEAEIDAFLKDNGVSSKQLKMLPAVPKMTTEEALAALKNPQLLDYNALNISPTKDMTPLELGAAGAGKAVVDKVRGAGQILGINSQDDIDSAKRLDAPLMATKQGQIGNAVGDIGIAAPIPYKNIQTAMGAGGLLSALTPTGAGDSRLKNTALGTIGGAAGYGAGKVLGGALAGKDTPPMRNMDDFSRADAMSFLKNNDIPTTYAENMGSPWSKQAEKILSGLPGSSGFYQNLRSNQATGVNNVIGNMTGGDVGSQFNQFGQGKNVTLDKQLFDDLANIKNKFGGLAQVDLPNSAIKAIDSYTGAQVPNPALNGFSPQAKAAALKAGVPEFIWTKQPVFQEGQKIPFSGEVGDFNNFSALRSLYGKRAYDAGDPVDKSAYTGMRDSFDSVVDRQFPQEAGQYADLKSKYSVERNLAPALDESGNYSLPKIKNIVQKKDAESTSILNGLTGDRGDVLRNLAQAEPFVKPGISSGTAENSLWQKLATGGMLSGGGMAGMLSSGGDPAMGLLGMAGGAGALGAGLYAFPWLTNKMLQSRVLGNPALERALIQALSVPGVAGPQLMPKQ